MMNKEKAFGLLNELNADAILLLNEANMHYMCGFSPSEGMVFITKDGGAYHIVDSRYIETAQENAKETGLTAIEPDTDFYTELKRLADKHGITSLVIENETISLLQYQKVFAKLGGVKLIDLNDRIMRIRNRKEPEEIVYMKKANAIAEAAFTELLNHVKAGKTEKELASYFDYLMAKNGSYGLSFDTILLTGAHTSMPHGVPSDKVINEGDFVLFDFGATYKGYHSDMTRTVAVGNATEEMKSCYSLVLEAQTAGIKALSAGVKCADVYKAAYDVLERENMAQYFRHGLGHGVGLEIHEGFNSNPRSTDTYEVGNVTSVEPGIYLPDKFGIRIEDVCYLSSRGRENLSTITKELIIL